MMIQMDLVKHVIMDIGSTQEITASLVTILTDAQSV